MAEPLVGDVGVGDDAVDDVAVVHDPLLVNADLEVVGGEVDDLVLGLVSYREEEHQVPATDLPKAQPCRAEGRGPGSLGQRSS